MKSGTKGKRIYIVKRLREKSVKVVKVEFLVIKEKNLVIVLKQKLVKL